MPDSNSRGSTALHSSSSTPFSYARSPPDSLRSSSSGSTSRSGSGSGSWTGSESAWVYDASVEMDLELGSVNGSSSGRDLVWQASQSPCDALNKLMDDAQNETREENSITESAWSPSPSSFLSTNPISTTSCLTSSRRPSRCSNTSYSGPARRTRSKPTPADPEPVSPLPAPELVQRIRIVGKQVNAKTERNVRAIERAKLKAQHREGYKKADVFVSSSRKVPSRQEGADELRGGREGATEGIPAASSTSRIRRSQSFPFAGISSFTKKVTGAKAVDATRENEKMGLDSDTLRMPPPASVPTKRTRSGNALGGLRGSQIPGTGSENLPFMSRGNANSALEHQMPTSSPSSPFNVMPKEVTSKAMSTTTCKGSSSMLALSQDDDIHTATDSETQCLSSNPADTPEIKVRRCSSPPTKHPSPPAPAVPEPTPVLQMQMFENSFSSNAEITSRVKAEHPPARWISHPSAPPRSQGPPALGMRRYTSSQSPSATTASGNGTRLPTKQKKFSPPLLKDPSATPEATAPAPTSPAVRISNPEERAAIVARARARQLAQTKVQDNQEVLAFHSAQSVRAEASSGVKGEVKTHDRSSSPAAGADDSLASSDFDLDIDEEELEKACSIYD